MYQGALGVSLGYDRFIHNNVVVGGSIQYDIISSKYPEIFDTKASFIYPALKFGYNQQFGKIVFTPYVNAGYTFIRFSNKSHPQVKENNKGGISLKPAMDIAYQVSQNFLVGLTVDYSNIFTKFLKDAFHAEESRTRYYSAGLLLKMTF